MLEGDLKLNSLFSQMRSQRLRIGSSSRPHPLRAAELGPKDNFPSFKLVITVFQLTGSQARPTSGNG